MSVGYRPLRTSSSMESWFIPEASRGCGIPPPSPPMYNPEQETNICISCSLCLGLSLNRFRRTSLGASTQRDRNHSFKLLATEWSFNPNFIPAYLESLPDPQTWGPVAVECPYSMGVPCSTLRHLAVIFMREYNFHSLVLVCFGESLSLHILKNTSSTIYAFPLYFSQTKCYSVLLAVLHRIWFPDSFLWLHCFTLTHV
jgi:hypothetical protein